MPYNPTLRRSIVSESRRQQRVSARKRNRRRASSGFRKFLSEVSIELGLPLYGSSSGSSNGARGRCKDGQFCVVLVLHRRNKVETVERLKDVSFDRLQRSIAAKECMNVPRIYFKTPRCHCQSLRAGERGVERRRRKSLKKRSGAETERSVVSKAIGMNRIQ